MRGRLWLVLGVALGIAIGIDRLAYFAGAANSLSDTAERLVRSCFFTLIAPAERRHNAGRAIGGVFSFVDLLVPGATALLLVAAARLSLRLRALVGIAVVLLGASSFHYLAAGSATGTLALALAAGALAVFATGPLLAAPLAALAALIGTEFLPRLVSGHRSVPRLSVEALHRALFASPGAPLWLVVVVLVIAIVPFAIAARLVVS